MKTILSILLLLRISFNVQADHEETLELDYYEISINKIYLQVYNKSSSNIYPQDFYWLVTFDDGIERVYRTSGTAYDPNIKRCMKYSDCTWYIKMNKQGANKIAFTHSD